MLRLIVLACVAQQGRWPVLYCYARLTDEQLAKLQAYESETGKKVIALAELDLEAEELAQDELTKLQELEETLGCVLLAVK